MNNRIPFSAQHNNGHRSAATPETGRTNGSEPAGVPPDEVSSTPAAAANPPLLADGFSEADKSKQASETTAHPADSEAGIVANITGESVVGSAIPTVSGEETIPQPYACSLPPSSTYTVVRRAVKLPPIDFDHIETVAAASVDIADGRRRVEGMARAQVAAAMGTEGDTLRAHQQFRSANLQARRAEVADLSRRLRRDDPFLDLAPAGDDARRPLPWTVFERAELVAAIGTSVIALAIGIYNSANLLNTSGNPAFNHWLSCLAFSSAPLLGVIGAKLFGRMLPAGAPRRNYARVLLVTGLLTFAAWVLCFTPLFGQILASDSELLAGAASLADHSDESTGGHGSHGVLLMVFGIFADTLLSAGAWLVAAEIGEAHRLKNRVANPNAAVVRQKLDEASRLRDREAELLGLCVGRLRELAGLEASFVEKALSLYDAETAPRRLAEDSIAKLRRRPRKN